jgi:hypothetical protein
VHIISSAGKGLRTCRYLLYPVLLIAIFGNSAAVAVDRYFKGDWVGYTSTRFVTSAAVGPEYVYFGTRGGIMFYDRFRDRMTGTYTMIDHLPTNRISSVAYDPQQSELYARTLEGDYVLNPASEEFELTSEFPEEMVVPWRHIDLSGYNVPFGYSTLEAGFITDTNLRDFPVQGKITDDWGNVWVGTWGLGVWRSFSNYPSLERIVYGLGQSNVRSVDHREDQWWFAGPRLDGEPGGVTVYDTLHQSWQYYEARSVYGLTSDDVLDLAHTGDTMWIATAGGLTRLRAANVDNSKLYNEFSGLLSDVVTSLEPDGDMLWIGTDLGINVLYLPQDSLMRAIDRLTAGVYVYDLKVVDDFLWMGTDRGLFRLYKNDNQWRRFSSADNILNGRVRAIDADDTAFYFGTDFGLAIVYRDGSGIREYMAGDIFPGSDIYAVAVTDRIVWASTPYGLVRFDPDADSFRIFTREDGLFADFVQVIYPDGDYLWLGTQEGVQRFRWNNPYRID